MLLSTRKNMNINDGAKVQCIVQGEVGTFASDSKMVAEYRAEPIRRYYFYCL